MRAHSPAASIVLKEFQWIHHTNAIASVISLSDGMCERGDGKASGGTARQSVRLSGRKGGRRDDAVFDDSSDSEEVFDDEDDSEREFLWSEDMEGRW